MVLAGFLSYTIRQGGKTADWLSKMTQWTLLNSNAPARAFDF